MAASSELLRLIASNKVLILSKTSCGYCSRSKALFRELQVKDVTVIELDQRDDGPSLQSAAYVLLMQFPFKLECIN